MLLSNTAIRRILRLVIDLMTWYAAFSDMDRGRLLVEVLTRCAEYALAAAERDRRRPRSAPIEERNSPEECG